MKPLKLKQIRTYQSVKFGTKEYTTFLSGDPRTDSVYLDLEMWLIGDRVFLRHKERGLEKIIFTTNISDIQTEENGILDLALLNSGFLRDNDEPDELISPGDYIQQLKQDEAVDGD